MTNPSALVEALWEASRDYGVSLAVADQVAVAQMLAAKPLDELTSADVQAAFIKKHLPSPPARFANAVAKRARALQPPPKPPPAILVVLLAFRQSAVRNLSREFGGKTRGREDELRNYLVMYLPQRGYAEAHTGKGRTDILIPPPVDAIIEAKIWTNERTYRDGVVELGSYIRTEQPRQAYMIVFGDRIPLPSIIDDPDQVTAAEEHLEGLTVPVVVVPFEVDAPSKVAANQRRRDRGK